MIRCNLAILLAEKGLKITDVSRATGISRTTLTSLVNNNGKGIQFDTLNVLCNYLNTTPDKIISYTPIDIEPQLITRMDENENKDLLDEIMIYTIVRRNLIDYNCMFKASCNIFSIHWPNEDYVPKENSIEAIDITVNCVSFNDGIANQQFLEDAIRSLPEPFKNDLKNKIIDLIIKYYGPNNFQKDYKCTFSWNCVLW